MKSYSWKFVTFAVLFGSLISASAPVAQAARVKVTVEPADTLSLPKGATPIADYGSYKVYEIDVSGVPATLKTQLRPDWDTIQLNAATIATSRASKTVQISAATKPGKQLQLLQFTAPPTVDDFNALEQSGAQIVDVIPSNAYLIYGDNAALSKAAAFASSSSAVQWLGAYQDNFKIQPSAVKQIADGSAGDASVGEYAIQLVKDSEANDSTVGFIAARSATPIKSDQTILHYRNVVASLSSKDVVELSDYPDVISISAFVTPKKRDERQNMIVSGNVTGNAPTPGSYLTFLANRGFTQSQFTTSNFVVDVSDSGIDNGTVSPNHFALFLGGITPGTSRVVYNRLEGTPNTGSTLAGCDGHGNINAHIIGGFVPFNTAPHVDAQGFRYGLGVCPFVKVGSSVIFDPNSYTFPNFPGLASRAYNNGARISSNSWGADVAGAYNSDSQAYDILTRDAQPAGSAFPVAGNQEMLFVFAGGNAGSGAQTVGSPGTGKNVLTVAAGENVHPFGGADACGVTDAQADNFNDMVNFSSRGPCADGRVKPDITAPGTHITGGVAQAASPGTSGTALACFTAGGVCAGPGGSNFFPAAGQQFYTASSGTSHSCPAVAGAAALLRQHFLNLGRSAPSPALSKAVLMATTRYMAGVATNDNLPSNVQGTGLLDIGRFTDGTTEYIREQSADTAFTASGQQFVRNMVVVNPAKPIRVAMAYTDVQGATTGNAFVNNLDLEVITTTQTLKGNVFVKNQSVEGGVADTRNNVECVFLNPGISGNVTIRVRATAILGDGVPNSGGGLDQDFALYGYNLTEGDPSPFAATGNVTIVSEQKTNGVADVDEVVTIALPITNVGTQAYGNLNLTGIGTLACQFIGSSPVNYGSIAVSSSVTRNITVRLRGRSGSAVNIAATLTDSTKPSYSEQINFSLPLGSSNTTQHTISYTGPSVYIPDNSLVGVSIPVKVSGMTGSVSDLDFFVGGSACNTTSGSLTNGLTHTWVGDVRMVLVAPSGKSANIVTNRGGSGNNMCNTLFDDSAAALASSMTSSGVPPTGPPYTGSFKPDSLFSAFNGENPNGTWTLRLFDTAAIDIGYMNEFQIRIRTSKTEVFVPTHQVDSFTTDSQNITPGIGGWSVFGSNIAGLTTADWNNTNQALRGSIFAHPSKQRVIGYSAARQEWLPYAVIGSDFVARAKFHIFAAGAPTPTGNSIAPLRVRVSNRFAVNSMLEVFGHQNVDPSNEPILNEIRPSNNPATPSVYTVDFNPVNVPYLVANAHTEGVLRAFEAFAQDPQDYGSIELAECSLHSYTNEHITTYGLVPQRVLAPTASDAGELQAFTPASEITLRKLILGATPGDPPTNDATSPQPTHTQGTFGITVNTTTIPTDRVGVVSREFRRGLDQTLYVRIAENRQYKARFHLTSTQQSSQNAQFRLRARTLKFGWTQKYEIGGAHATGSGSANNQIAQQALPGIGSQNPDKDGTEAGGWYTLLMHSPMDVAIRPEFSSVTPLATRMPLISAQPGPGVNSASVRDVRLGFDVLDTTSGGASAGTEQGDATLDRIELFDIPRVEQ